MGIFGLLPSLKEIQEEKHIRSYCGSSVGVDALCWYFFLVNFTLGCIREHINVRGI